MTSSPSLKSPILAIDWGDRHVGVSFSPDGKHNAIRETLTITGIRDGIAQVEKIITQEKVRTLVVGLPLTLRSEKGTMAKTIESHARVIADQTHVTLQFVDERETTNLAERLQSSFQGFRVDSIVAFLLLEEYLAKQNPNTSY